jgi:hypothetical protein
MINQAMQEKLNSKEAVDISRYDREGSYYILPFAPAEAEYCNAKTEQWIRSIGRRKSDGVILASEQADLYENPAFECLWLR